MLGTASALDGSRESVSPTPGWVTEKDDVRDLDYDNNMMNEGRKRPCRVAEWKISPRFHCRFISPTSKFGKLVISFALTDVGATFFRKRSCNFCGRVKLLPILLFLDYRACLFFPVLASFLRASLLGQ